MRNVLSSLLLFALTWATFNVSSSSPDDDTPKEKQSKMQLGNFSVSLTVKDLAASREFYEKLGFKVSGGKMEHKYLVLQNDTSTIGLYQGMFEKNMLTYNPGWDRDCQTLPEFQDVREIQKALKTQGLTLDVSADEATTGPAYLSLVDPDGNPILIDQHVPKPNEAK